MRADPGDLRLFLAVLECGTLTAGAERVHLSLAAASERIQRLEHALGVALFERSKRGVKPTAASATLAEHARQVLQQLDRLHTEMSPYARGMRGRVRLACNTSALTEFLPEALGRFLASNPDIDVDLREMWSHEIVQALHAQRADIGILADSVDTTGLQTFAFRDDRLVLIAPKRRGRRSRAPIAFVDALEHAFIGLSPESGLSRFLEHQALRIARNIHYRVRVKGFEAVRRLVACGVGVAIVPQSAAVRGEGMEFSVQGLTDGWATRRLLLSMASAEALPPYVRKLVAALRAPEAGRR